MQRLVLNFSLSEQANSGRFGRSGKDGELPSASIRVPTAVRCSASVTRSLRLRIVRGEQALDMIIDKSSSQLLENTDGIDWTRIAEQVCLSRYSHGSIPNHDRYQGLQEPTPPQSA
jgi:hypothetical protein